MTVTVRFAPSPTGRLHIGNIRTALINWLFAQNAGGQFVLRLDDTDAGRSTEEFAQGIRDDLNWLGLLWDVEARQSVRRERHDAAVERLKASGRLYACYETPEELERKRKRQLAQGLPPIYDRAAVSLAERDRAALEAEGRKPHWRFLLEPREVAWRDLVRGEQHVDAGSVSDPILLREDGTYLYTLPSVVDDIDLGITHVIRGEDHVANTAAQIELFEALGARPPAFGHHSLLVSPDGAALSKRLGNLSIDSFRSEGLEPMTVTSLAATLGTSDPVRPFADLDQIAEAFDLGKFSRAPARFDPGELRQLNAKLLLTLPYQAVAARLMEQGIEGGAAFWEAVRGNISLLSDTETWSRVVAGPIAPVMSDVDLTGRAAELLPAEPFGAETWGAWTAAITQATGVKGGKLFKPLRLALTGLEHGPELKQLLPLIGRERAMRRLAGETA